MIRAGVAVLAGVACMMGALARPLAAQQMPSHDSLLAMTRRALPPSASSHECPMPVAIPDLSRSERMPVAPTDARGHFIQVVPPGCVNPLFRGPLAARSQRSLEPAPGSPHSFPRLWPPILHRDSLPALGFPFPGADPNPGLRLPLHPPER